ncbi:unnamed protein product [Heligmosomoides polygyrus]|uniref:DUF1559 domain-containing protein n=1 Tax=Heligmosomoides polygyrus TaxID=6339 RepID=A0A3P7WNH0_HELPZ|nr:unnamed protein product [Heligmosomoides polygyrus]
MFEDDNGYHYALNDRYDALRVPERGGSIGPLWHATGTNGDAAGARSSKSMINGTTSIGALWHATETNGDAAGARSSKSVINGTTDDTGLHGSAISGGESPVLLFGPRILKKPAGPRRPLEGLQWPVKNGQMMNDGMPFGAKTETSFSSLQQTGIVGCRRWFQFV